MDYADGKFFVKGVAGQVEDHSGRRADGARRLEHAAGVEAGLEASMFYDPPNFTYPFGSHVAVVEVDPETGQIDLKRYVALDDCGPQINPVIVEGQVHGGVVQGIGQALWEEAVYDEAGQLLTGSMLDYALPRADGLCDIEVHQSTVTPSPHHPLGLKGIGEAGTIASTAAVYNAVLDALAPFGVETLQDAVHRRARLDARFSRPKRVDEYVCTQHSTTTARARSLKPATCFASIPAPSCLRADTA